VNVDFDHYGLPAWFTHAACRQPGTNPDWWHDPPSAAIRRHETNPERTPMAQMSREERKAYDRRRVKRGYLRAQHKKAAITICNHCPILARCLLYAIDNPHIADAGIWGGLTTEERQHRTRFTRREP